MSRRQHLAAGLLLALGVSTCSAADPDEIVRRAAAVLRSDWAADADYAYIEKDEVLKNGRMTSKTSQVVYIDGSDYYLPLALEDQPLPEDRAKAERAKLKAEAVRRNAESPEQRRDRIARYKKERDANEALIVDFPNAFRFELAAGETIDGRKAWVLSGAPIKRAGPLSSAAKVLSGMQGTVWLDQEGFHVIRASCDVIRPVPVYGVLAKVLPGTHIEFAMTPVTESVWLVSEMRMKLAISKFFIFHSTQVTRTTFTNYRLNSDVLAELLGN